jgi:hypothetical protein
MNYSEHIYNCINKTLAGHSKLNEKAITMRGMSSFNVRNLLNLLLEMPNAKYLEVGVWKGSTFYSALYKNNPYYALAIDNWSEFKGSVKFFLQTISDLECEYNFLNKDSFLVDVNSEIKEKINIYFYDGNHSKESQTLAITHYIDGMEDEFIYICDDWNFVGVPEGTLEAIQKVNLLIEKSWILKADYAGDVKNWWNGLWIAHLKKGKK